MFLPTDRLALVQVKYNKITLDDIIIQNIGNKISKSVFPMFNIICEVNEFEAEMLIHKKTIMETIGQAIHTYKNIKRFTKLNSNEL